MSQTAGHNPLLPHTYWTYSDNCVTHAFCHHAPAPPQRHIKLSLSHLTLMTMLHSIHTFIFIHYSNFFTLGSVLHLVCLSVTAGWVLEVFNIGREDKQAL